MRKIMNKITRFLKNNKKALTVVSVIGALMIGVIVGGASNSTIKISIGSGTGYYHASYSNNSYTKYGDVQNYNTSTGETVFCAEPGTEIDYKTNLDVYRVSDEEFLEKYNETSEFSIDLNDVALMKAYAYFGYGNTGTTNEYRAATAMLIWRVVDSSQVFTSSNCIYNTDGEYDDDGNTLTEPIKCSKIDDPSAVAEAMQVIQAKVDEYMTDVNFSKGTKQNGTIGDTFIFTDTSETLSNYIVDSCTNCTAEISGNTLTVIPTNVGTYSVTLALEFDNYDDDMGLIATKSSQNMIVVGNIDSKYVSVSGEVTGAKIQVTKYDSDNKSCFAQGDATLKGAQYAIYDSDGKKVDTLTIGSNCLSNESTELSLGIYTVKEITAPEGYNISSDVQTVEVTSSNSGTTIGLTFTNEVKTYKLELIKTMSDGTTGIVDVEEGATFDIYLTSSYKFVKTITTDSDGKASVTLPYGIYTVVQTSGTANYFLADEFTVNLKSEDQSVVINNSELTAKLKVVKIDSETGEVIPVSGIKFKIWSVEDEDWVSFNITYPTTTTIDVFETDANGEFTTPYVLGSGTYIIYEVDQTIDGYVWNSEGLKAEISFDADLSEDEDGNTIVLIYFENTPVKGSVDLTKIGEVLICENGSCTYTTEHLEGITFGLYAREDIVSGTGTTIYKAGDLVTTLVTDENGKASVSGLYLGKYYLKELETLDTYLLDETEYDFELTYVDQYITEVTYSTTVTNYYNKTTVKFYKKDFSDDQLLLAGATICVYTVDGDLVECLVTDSDGFAAIALPVGDYYYVETIAPEGYKLDDEVYYFSITDGGQTLVVDVLNEYLVVNAPNTNISNFEIIIIVIALFGGVTLVALSKKYSQNNTDNDEIDTNENAETSNEDDEE